MKLEVDAETLEPLVKKIVGLVVAELSTTQLRMDDRIAIDEPEAARLLTMTQPQLRDERLRGRIRATQISGRKIRYTRADLLNYLAERTFPQHANRGA